MDNHIPNILLVDDDPHLLGTLGEILSVKGFEPIFAQTGGAALAQIERQPIDVALIDLKLGDMSGLDVLRGIKASSPETECILLTGNASQASAIEAIQMGAFGYIQKPFEVDLVVLSVQRASEKYRSTLALRESEHLLRESQTVAGLGSYVLDIPSGLWKSSDVLDRLFGIDGDYERSVDGWTALIHPDERAMMADYFRDEVLGQGKMFEKEYRIIRHNDQAERWVHGLGKLEYDAQGRPVKMHGTIQDVSAYKRAEEELSQAKKELELVNMALQTALTHEKELAHTDALTGINNRRYLFELAEDRVAVALRYGQPLAVMMFDIDHFKKVNDAFGHAIGDQMLKYVTQIACAELRSADVIGRYGGEEFIILLPMTNAQQSYLLAERIRAGVAALRVPAEKGNASVTLSIGIVELSHVPRSHSESVEDVFRRADKAMYTAKQAGRNRVVIADLEGA